MLTLGDLLLPDTQALDLEEIEVKGNIVLVKVASTQETAVCPSCRGTAYRVHSRYYRILDDLPCGGHRVQLHWKIRRFFCDNYACSKLTFCECLPQVAKPYAHKTQRLQEQQIHIGFEVGGESGKRLAGALKMQISGDQILRSLRSKPEPNFPTPRVLGVDDWAIKRGRVYGTILIDLEKRQVIDLLPDRKPETLAAWLSTHTGVEMISRDRGKEYIEGIGLANQELIEVADRFHLLKNLVEMLQQFFERCPSELKLAAQQNSDDPTIPSAIELPNDKQNLEKDQSILPKDAKKTHRQVLFEEVKSLAEQGMSQRAIARKTNLNRRTVRKYIYLNELPRKFQTIYSTSKAAPFMGFIQQHWNQNECSIRQLFNELKDQGFTGSYSSISRAIHAQLGVHNLKKSHVSTLKHLRYSPRAAAWAIFQPDQELKDAQKTLCRTLCDVSPLAMQARSLALSFREIITCQQADKLDEWLVQAENSQIIEFARFAAGLRGDYKAVKAALTYSWSNGQVEGQVNRLKLIKRQMYGRAGFDLLRRRVLGPAPVL